MFVDCKQSSPRQLYDFMQNAVVPRPIAWVSTRSAAGVDNLAPFSFFNVFSVNPPVLGFSPGMKRVAGGEPVMKDSLKNLLETGDFVVNMVSAEMARDMVLSSAEYPPDQSEFEVLGLTPLPSVMVAAPRLGESKVSMECRLLKVIELGSNNLVLGEVLCAHVDDGVLTGGLIDVEKLQPLARLGGQLYAAICNPFEIERP